jgi:alkylhydroperoxidase/carboxymuconolactone decarboxylase family protein YurZ
MAMVDWNDSRNLARAGARQPQSGYRQGLHGLGGADARTGYHDPKTRELIALAVAMTLRCHRLTSSNSRNGRASSVHLPDDAWPFQDPSVGRCTFATAICDGCITVHTVAARKLGATQEQFAEAPSIGIGVNAGAALVYSARTLKAFNEWRQTEPLR